MTTTLQDQEMTEVELEKEVQVSKESERDKAQKVRHLLINNSHPGAERFPSVTKVTEYGLEVDEYVGLLKQMHKSRELQFSVDKDKIDDVLSEAFFGQGIDGVELVQGPKNMADAVKQGDLTMDIPTTSMDQTEYSLNQQSRRRQSTMSGTLLASVVFGLS